MSAASTARRIRKEWIGLTYELPEPASPKLLRLWDEADDAVRRVILALQELESP